jgi:hypothetical protein
LTETVDRATARKTALVVATVLGAIAAWQLYRGRPTAAIVLGAIAIALSICGLMIPPAAKAFHRAWMRFAGVLGYVNSRILLSVVYYLMITPTGLLVRAAGHDPLDRRRDQRASYWVRRSKTRQSREEFERAF